MKLLDAMMIAFGSTRRVDVAAFWSAPERVVPNRLAAHGAGCRVKPAMRICVHIPKARRKPE
jgi:hypothetical protein